MANEQKSETLFAKVETLPPDAIFFTKQAYLADPDARKINLGIGAYRDDSGKPKVLNIVKKVQNEIIDDINNNKLNKEYFPIGGDPDFIKLSQQLILGNDSKALSKNFVAGAQSLSGTGVLRLLFVFIARNLPNATIHISKPTWGNHITVIRDSGLKQKEYRYWDEKKRGLNLEWLSEDLTKNAKKGDVVLLHACAHNPTGVDPTQEEWKKIGELFKKLQLIPFFDCAYQGFATGSIPNDAFAIRLFESLGFNFFISQSFAKNLGLYNDRIGCASIICSNEKEANACNTQLEAIIRPMYSNPPGFGALIVKKILGNNEYYKLWEVEMKEMSHRIIDMRVALRKKLEEFKTPGTWNHITDQIGMFSFTGLNSKQCESMINKHHIYMLKNGRISMAGVSSKNVEYIAKAINDVVVNIK